MAADEVPACLGWGLVMKEMMGREDDESGRKRKGMSMKRNRKGKRSLTG